MEMEMTVGSLITRLQNNYSLDDLCVASLWFDEDFLSKVWGEDLTRDEIHAAMKITSSYDANEGINWSVVEDAVERVLDSREDPKP
ncbi:hypothetical protein KGP17_27630 (plasmid) [Serratia sp. JSRIV001]|uniref:hypothetical protein n=1 Tax=unclassified Serratia (in: enterobacteria) TaxID=2647522 RepID=UPI001CC11597|nr:MULTISPECIES: hypothetical protein [unclassified Serratia (in: enterobacteria)]UAN48789.1 hypothetical protein KGP17_27630 [Serratia sp. JSRIV001]UAN54460.1 hypothetical protein KGP26_28755 [Serratia sp. JSRIV002]UAN60573.1 hypothetical protein KGP21_28970 [Serratia sp. JSRIV004]